MSGSHIVFKITPEQKPELVGIQPTEEEAVDLIRKQIPEDYVYLRKTETIPCPCCGKKLYLTPTLTVTNGDKFAIIYTSKELN